MTTFPFLFCSTDKWIPSKEVYKWVKENNCEYYQCTYFGDNITFPDMETLLIFKLRFVI